MGQALLNVVELTGDRKLKWYTDPGHVEHEITMPRRVYGSVLELAQKTGLNASLIATGTNPIKYQIKLTFTAEVYDLHGEVGPLLGFRGDEALLGYTQYGTYAPQKMWVPTFHTSDTEQWTKDNEALFRSSRGSDGRLSGISLPSRESRSLTWPWEKASNVFSTSSSDIVYRVRSFESVINRSRTDLQNLATSSTYVKGLYWVDNMSNFTAPDHTTIPSMTWGSGEIYSNGNPLFCTADAPNTPSASNNTSNKYYDIGVKLYTAIAPDWSTT